ncbi:hypothetical protein AHiyo8_pI69350 (plasmid) [Arthrobacter sp. Hiyo8]|uniref:hypothetical protein n=1 Tax=Arthrobacter sp. Hiyo1 TaxID=1588020 RepID=UPI0006838637|nr:hypothetical protein [Arthrobacter sp. Hiyo1]BAS18631.1 hypothetical protein AHiyo8_pI69350 [Arthrobacter sp. Hiyo8]GAP60669.1 hypothetical protein AHiyo1_42410 [Arthrobacter sp. Hiyo1]
MNAQVEALKSLKQSGLYDLLTWSARAAFARTNDLYEEEAGHDQGVVGYLNYKHLLDLMDRATANGRFSLGEDVEGVATDVIQRGITPEAFRTMPALAPGTVKRSDYRDSPGWSSGSYRVLLQSFTLGKIDGINWARRSEAKRVIASQKASRDTPLFEAEDFGLSSPVDLSYVEDFEGVTLVAAHAHDPVTGQYEMYIGQSKNPAYRGDSCWQWREEILSGGNPSGGTHLDLPSLLPGDAATRAVDDIDVRIKTPNTGRRVGAADA